MLSLHVPAAYTSRYPCNLWTSICLAISSYRLCLMRFVFLGAEVCVRLPSDSASQRTPLPSANGWRLQTPIADFHHLACYHARHTSSRKIGIISLSVLSHHRTYRSVYGGSLIIFSDQLIIIRQEDITSLTKPIGGKRSTKDKTISSVPVAFPSIRPLPSFGFRYS